MDTTNCQILLYQFPTSLPRIRSLVVMTKTGQKSYLKQKKNKQIRISKIQATNAFLLFSIISNIIDNTDRHNIFRASLRYIYRRPVRDYLALSIGTSQHSYVDISRIFVGIYKT